MCGLRVWWVLPFLLWSAGCLRDRLVDAEGYGCAEAVDCPAPFVCTEGVCRLPVEAGPKPVPQESYVVVAAGGIACDPGDPDFAGGQGTSKVCRMSDTAALAEEAKPDAVLALGELQRDDGARAKFMASYALHWGKPALRERTSPVPGPTEYQTPGAEGFFSYFPELRARAAGQGYYAFSLGGWRVLALNSACSEPSVGGCGPESPQGRWLADELSTHPQGCTLAFLYAARFSSAGDAPEVQPLWEQLSAGGVDVVLSAGGHHYERFAPLSAQGTRDETAGMRSFLLGTGGARLGSVSRTAAFSEQVGVSHGVLRLLLREGGYDWRFLAVADQPLDDRGAGVCH